MNNKIKRFFEPVMIEQKYFWRVIINSLIQSLYWVINIFFVQKITEYLELWNQLWLNTIIYYFVAFNFIYFATSTLIRKWWWAETYHHHVEKIHQIYMKKFNNLDNTYVENIWTWKIISILTKWVSVWTDMIIEILWTWTKLMVSLISAWIILYSLWNLYLFIFFFTFFILHVVIYYLNEWALKWRRWRIDTINEYDRQLVKMIMSKFEILQNNKIDREVGILDKYIRQAKYYNVKLNDYLFAMFSMPSFVFFIWTLGVLILVTKYKVSFSSLISVLMILQILNERFRVSIDFFKNFTKDIYAVEKMWKLFDDWPLINCNDDYPDFIYKKWDVKIQNITFSYWNNTVLDNFSIELNWGKKTAFVWVSWSWKTTLIKLIAWFLTGNEWKIFVDWQNIAEVNLNSYYKNIWYLTQEPSVFDWTIIENLTYWLRQDNIIKDELDKVIRLSWCEFIYDLPKWLETEIGERWVRLSWWQKQRLSIAKLFIKDPHLIILDEPTSALDSFSEELISESLAKLFEWRTVLIIAHRLQTVKNADDIIVFEDGNIVERWNHNALIKKNGYYKKMLDLQSWF